MSRTGRVERATAESKVLVEVDLDGTGTYDVSTGIGFYDHMLAQLGKQGGCGALRQRARPARRGARAGGGRPVRTPVRRTRRAGRTRAHDRPDLPDQPDPAHLGVVRADGAAHPARLGAARGSPAGRAPRGGGAVQGGGAGAAAGMRVRSARRVRRAQHEGRAVMAARVVVLDYGSGNLRS